MTYSRVQIANRRAWQQNVYNYLINLISIINCSVNFSFLQALRERQKEAVVISSISDIILEYVSETVFF